MNKPLNVEPTVSSHSSSLISRLGEGLVWSLIGAIATQGGTLAVNIIGANVLGQALFGEFAVLQGTAMVLSMVGQSSTAITARKYIAQYRSMDRFIAGKLVGVLVLIAVISGLIVALTQLGFSNVICTRVLLAPQLGSLLRLMSVFVLFSVINGAVIAIIGGLEQFRSLSTINIVGGLIQIVIYAVSSTQWGLSGAVVGMVVGSIVQVAMSGLLLLRALHSQGIALSFGGVKSECLMIMNFALPCTLIAIVTSGGGWVANASLVRQADGLSQMALFAAANNFRMIALFFPNVMINMGISVLNNQRGLRDKAGFGKTFWLIMFSTLGCVLVSAGTFAIFGRLLLRVYGEAFVAAYPVLVALMACAVVEALALALNLLVQSSERMWLSLVMVNIPMTCLLVAASLILSERHRALGLAISHACTWFLGLLLLGIITVRAATIPKLTQDPTSVEG